MVLFGHGVLDWSNGSYKTFNQYSKLLGWLHFLLQNKKHLLNKHNS